MEPLIYRGGDFLYFADRELVRARLGLDDDELRRLTKALYRQATVQVRLSVREVSEVEDLAEYWGRGGRRTDLKPLLESISTAGPGASIDIVHLLPVFARNHLYRYPQLSSADLDKPIIANCLWSSLNFFNPVPDDRFLDVPYALEHLRADYYLVSGEFELGDVVAFMDEDGDLFHVAVYLADDLLFSKNGTSPMSPWTIQSTEEVKGFYRTRSRDPQLLYHRREGY